MDSEPPSESPFSAVLQVPAVKEVTTKVTNMTRRANALLDSTTPYPVERWAATGVLLFLFMLRIVLAQGWYIGA